MERNEILALECASLRAYRASCAGPDNEFARYLERLKRVTDGVLALGDGMDNQPWFRIHAELVRSGVWARLKPASRSVYIVLASLSDRRKRVTYAGVERVASLAGLSRARTVWAYRELRDYGLIWRRRVSVAGYRPYATGLLSFRRGPFDKSKDQASG